MLFSNLGLSKPIQKAILEQGYTKPTPIQAKAIPVILGKKDVLAGAQTGTGKTAGFTLPILHQLSAKRKQEGKPQVRALILTPTRELASQVEQSVQDYGKYLNLKSSIIFGGVGINPQISTLRKGVDIVVATPGRLLDHIERKTIDLSGIEFLVLDEADRMLDMGFIHDIKKIIALLPKHRQNLLFSATFSNEIKKLADSLLNSPVLIEVAKRNTTSQLVKQSVYRVDKDNKKALLTYLINNDNWSQVLVFTRTKHGANKLSKQLISEGISSDAIHGNKSQNARTTSLNNFKSKKTRVLVATDIAARGIDIEQLPHVVNYELPNIPEDYVHRIGRTGRAKNAGEAISLVCVDENLYLQNIEKLIKEKIETKIIEEFKPDPSIKAQPAKKQGFSSSKNRSKRVREKNHRGSDKREKKQGIR